MADVLAPVFVGLLDHAGDEIDVDLREADRAREVVGADRFRSRPMRAAVDLENVAVEVLDAEDEPRDADLAERAELLLGQRAGLASKVTSSASSHGSNAFIRSVSDLSCLTER